MAGEIATEVDRKIDCKKCELRKGARFPVWGEGKVPSKFMIVGEAPGAEEDKQRRPFVGPAGEILRKKLQEMGVDPKDVYITNICKCRPPNNRKPRVEEMQACLGNLEKEICIVGPKVIVALGATATKAFLKKTYKMKDVNGQFFNWHTYNVVPVFHPAAQLHYKKAKKAKEGSEPPDDFDEPRKLPIDYFNEGIEKAFGEAKTAVRQRGLDDFV